MSVFDSFSKFSVFFTSLMVGLTMVIGVSAINSAPAFMLNYYQYILGSADAVPENPKFWQTVLTFYSVVTMVTQTIFGPINLTTFCCRLSLLFRLTASGVLMLIELLVILLLPVSAHVTERTAMAALMVVAFVGGFGRAFYENTGYALFGPLPSVNMSGIMMGVSVCGVLTSLLQIIIKASMPDNFRSIKTQSHIYFSIAIGIVVLSGVLILALAHNSYARGFVAEFRSKDGFFANIYRPRSAPRALPPTSTDPVEGHCAEAITHSAPEDTFGSAEALTEGTRKPMEEDEVAVPQVEDPSSLTTWTSAELLQQAKLCPILRRIYSLQFSVCLNYLITYLLYPGVMLAVDYEDAWFGTIVMAVFNLGDLIGRALCLFPVFWISRRWVVITSVLRLVFLPLLLLCAKGVIPTHAAAYALSTAMGATSGYCGTMAMTYAPNTKGLVSYAERALAGQAAGVGLLFGISVGSLLQLAIVLKL